MLDSLLKYTLEVFTYAWEQSVLVNMSGSSWFVWN